MIRLNNYINEAWSGVKKHTISQPIIDWCEEMRIKNYTINDKGEIDVDTNVMLYKKDFKELPYKFGTIIGSFIIHSCKNLTSLKNCPNTIESWFACSGCTKLDSLEGCPKEVNGDFFCDKCKRKFTEEEVQSLCKVEEDIVV